VDGQLIEFINGSFKVKKGDLIQRYFTGTNDEYRGKVGEFVRSTGNPAEDGRIYIMVKFQHMTYDEELYAHKFYYLGGN